MMDQRRINAWQELLRSAREIVSWDSGTVMLPPKMKADIKRMHAALMVVDPGRAIPIPSRRDPLEDVTTDELPDLV